MKRILVPCDFSPAARQAFVFAIQIAKRSNAELYVLKAIDFPFSYDGVYSVNYRFHNTDVLNELRQAAELSFEELKMESGGYEHLHFSSIQGPVVPVVQSFVEKENIDLVVMGTNGATGMKEYLVGSNTEKVVRFSPVPVISVREAIDLSLVRDILVPTDGGDVYPSFISALKELQELLDATLHLLVVSAEDRIMHGTMLLRRAAEYAYRAGLRDYTVSLLHGKTTEGGIIDFARKTNADMIAMATHGRQGLAHLFTGSVAEDVVNHITCPVWTFSVRNQTKDTTATKRRESSVLTG